MREEKEQGKKEEEEEKEEDEEKTQEQLEEEEMMRKVMGFTHFNTTKVGLPFLLSNLEMHSAEKPILNNNYYMQKF